MSLQVAINYDSGWYSTRGSKLMGANAASEGFLRAISQHAGVSRLGARASTPEHFQAFAQRVRSWNPHMAVGGFHPHALTELQKYDVLYHGDPVLAPYAWQRRGINPAGWSLCGVTHTTCSLSALSGIRDILLAPVHPWDAVICTSQAVLKTVQQVHGSFAEYLQMLGQGGTFKPQLELPVIPLGVDYDAISTAAANPVFRQNQRAALGIGDDAIVFLFLGRLVFHAKAHPLALFLALKRAAEATRKNVHLIMAGWFPTQEIEQIVRAGAEMCKNVRVHFVDGRKPEIREQIWSAGDVFISLVDNIQETFGLTPLEAMAARLPVIVSDWNGYCETVRHDVDGILIPTYAPSAAGLDWPLQYFLEQVNYDEYIGGTCQSTTVDVAAATEACVRLIQNPQLRQSMGAAGQLRVQQLFAWPKIISRYLDLWEELSHRRKAEEMPPATQPAKQPPIPWLNDPLVTFGHYTTMRLTPDVVLQLTIDGKRVLAHPKILAQVYQHRLLRFVRNAGLLLEIEQIEPILQHFVAGPQAAGTYLPASTGDAVERTWRTIGWLMKLDLLAVVHRPEPRSNEFWR